MLNSGHGCFRGSISIRTDWYVSHIAFPAPIIQFGYDKTLFLHSSEDAY